MNKKENALNIYAIMGFVNNYTGGLDLEEGVIQRFIVNQEIDDTVISHFEKVCFSYFEETKQDVDFQVERNKDMVIFRSKIICSEIRKICQLDSFLGRDYFRLSENIFDDVPMKSYYVKTEIGNKQRLAFLETALMRHKSEGKYYFYNDYEKAILTHRILSRFSNEGDEIKMISTFLTPWAISIEVKKDL